MHHSNLSFPVFFIFQYGMDTESGQQQNGNNCEAMV